MKSKLSLLILFAISTGLVGCNQDNTDPSDYLTFDIYSSNDFHGAVDETANACGLAKFGTYFKQKGEEANTLLLDMGDTWQGSIYSNYNYGALVNDVMSVAKFDARTIGNHDFDWGIDPLIANTSKSYNDYTIPVLAANVYDYDFPNKKVGSVHQDNIGGKTVAYTLENGLKVGIVGVIGENQITSICSNLVTSICFIDHNSVIKEEATRLREEGCQVVIACAHTGQDEVRGKDLDKYVDAVFCGHTHRNEVSNEGDLKFYQYGANGESFGHVTMKYNIKTGKVTSNGTMISGKTIKDEVKEIDPDINYLVTTYNSICDDAASEVVASKTQYFDKSEQSVNLMCKAVYDRCVSEGHGDVILTYCNTARAYLPKGQWTYADIYKSFPFDNQIFIVNLKGKDIYDEVKNYNNAYFNPDFDFKINPNQYYKIACIDFLLYHTNTARYFNYFPSFTGEPLAVLSDNYRIILKEWLIDNGYSTGNMIYSSDYASSVTCFNTSKLSLVN